MAEKLQLIISARDKFSGVMGRAGASVKGLNTNLFSLRNTMVGLAGLTGVGLLTKSIVSLGVEFEHTMRSVKVISAATVHEFGELEKAARLMGKTTEFTATQSADALRFLAMAGLDATQAVKALPQMLDLATAASMDLARAADISTNIMTQMSLEVEELTRVNDAMVGVQNTANTNVEQAGEAFVYAGTTAKAFGMDIEEVTGFIGLLANAGIRGSMAGSTLSNAMRKLLNETTDNKAILEKYGVELEMSDGKLRNFTDVVLELSDANITAREATKLFGARASGMLAILAQGRPEIEAYIQKLRDMGGVAKESADEMRKSFKNRFAEVRSIIQEDLLKTFEALEPTLDLLIEDFKEMALAVGEWVDANDELIQQNIADTIKGIGGAIDGIVNTYNSLPDGVVGAAGYGLIGRMLTGSTPIGVYTAGVALLADKVKNLGDTAKSAALFVMESIIFPFKFMADIGAATGAKGKQSSPIAPGYVPPVAAEETYGDYGTDTPTGAGGTYDIDFGQLARVPEDLAATKEAMNAFADYAADYSTTLKGDSDAGMFPQMLFGDDDSMTASLDRTKDGMDGFAEYMGEFTEALKPEDMDMDEFPGVVPAMIWGDDEAVEEKAEKWMEILQDWGEQVTDWAATIAAGIRGIFESVSNGIGEAVASAIVYQQNLGDALKALMKSIAADIIKMLVTILVKKMILWAAEQAGLVAKAKVEHTTAYMSTYANTFASWAGAPWPISILAPAMASANLAAVVAGTNAAAGAGAAAHGGLDYVPKEQTYLLDRGERVLSPNQNKDFTDFIRGDGSEGGGGSVTIEKIEILPNATNADAMFSMSTEMWEDIILDRIWPAMDALNRRGIEQTG